MGINKYILNNRKLVHLIHAHNIHFSHTKCLLASGHLKEINLYWTNLSLVIRLYV